MKAAAASCTLQIFFFHKIIDGIINLSFFHLAAKRSIHLPKSLTELTKIFPQIYLGGMYLVHSELKSEKKYFNLGKPQSGHCSDEKFPKNVDFSLRGNCVN